MRDKYKRFWLNDRLSNIAREESLVQGDWDIGKYVRELKDKYECLTFMDYGCGYGRMFQAFTDIPTLYFGIDLNPAAIAAAQKRYPRFKNRFAEVDIDSTYGEADMFLAFTVFLHLDDRALGKCLERIAKVCRKYLVVIETLGREWREAKNDNNHLPIFNRDLDDYNRLIERHGFSLVETEEFYNERYGSQVRYQDYNCNTNALVYKKV